MSGELVAGTGRVGSRRWVSLFAVVALVAGVLVGVAVPSGAAAGSGGGFSGVTPFRVLDTRQPSGGGCVGSTRDVTVAGVGGVPADAAAVVLNVTVVSPSAGGYVTVFPAGVARPSTSNVNFVAGQVIPNQVSVKIGSAGKVSLFASNGCPQLIVDIQGFYAGGAVGAGGFVGITPARSGDTRKAGGCVPANSSREFQVTGVGGVPVDAAGAVLNVTAVAPPSSGFFTVFPAGVTRPTASSLNFTSGQVIANAATVKIGAGGAVSVFNGTGGCAHMIVDVAGFYASGTPAAAEGGFAGVTPFRVVDTRKSGGCVPANSARTIAVTNVGGVPLDAAAVALNVTAVQPTGGGYVTVFPNGDARPTASNLNFAANDVIANAVNVKVGTAGSIVVFNGSGGCTNVIVDVVAHYRPTTPAAPPTVTSLSPTSGSATGGTVVTVTGTNLSGATAVKFGSTNATSFTVNSATQITATAPAGSAGQVDVTVVTSGGTSAASAGSKYTYVVPPATLTQIDAGYDHTCAVISTGSVKCWGDNTFGQLGTGSTAPAASPVTVAGIADATAVAAGAYRTCALRASGTVSCWGDSDLLPTTVAGLTGVTALSVSSGHGCAIVAAGAVKCWGGNLTGELGNGTTTDSLTPVTVTGITGATSIAAGEGYACAVVAAGAVKCWGSNFTGELGNGIDLAANPNSTSLTPVSVTGITGAVQVAAAGYGFAGTPDGGSTCALLSGGSVKCWGDNVRGVLAETLTQRTSTPQTIAGIAGVGRLDLSNSGICATLLDGTVRCWGNTDRGRPSGSVLPSVFTVAGLSGVTQVASGESHFCALSNAQQVKCWGDRRSGQLGNGASPDAALTPVAIAGVTSATQISAAGPSSCVLTAQTTLQCWGDQIRSLVSTDPASYSSLSSVPNLTGVTRIAAADTHWCAIVSRGSVKCAGSNSNGELGNGSKTLVSSTPVSVTGVTGATQIAVGSTASFGFGFGNHSCALITGGTVKCWGGNFLGQLGNGLFGGADSATAVDVPGVTGATQIAAAPGFTCALISGGTVKCWGANASGQLGDGTTGTFASGPVTVQGITTAVAVTAECALLAGGSVKCWGNGPLGNGTDQSSPTPVDVKGVVGAIALTSGLTHSCALFSNGTAKCWGDNSAGEIGDGTTGNALTPVLVAGLSGATQIAAAGQHTCAIINGGSAKCWGDGSQGQLGVSSYSDVPLIVNGLI